MLDTTIKVKTEQFDGPLGLLLMLVQKEEMKISELNITVITKQYLEYIAKMDELNFDVAGDYLYLAATLLLLKSNDCITQEEQDHIKSLVGEHDLNIPSQSELVRRLEELQHFQRMGEKLWGLPKKGHQIFLKPKVNRKAIINSILLPMDFEKLTMAMIDFIRKEKRKYTVIRRDRLSIKEKLAFLKEYLSVGQKTTFDDLMGVDGDDGIDNTVITFISLLELARLKKISIFQNEPMKNIFVEVKNSLDDFDVNSADGFDDENEAENNSVEEADLIANENTHAASMNEGENIEPSGMVQ